MFGLVEFSYSNHTFKEMSRDVSNALGQIIDAVVTWSG